MALNPVAIDLSKVNPQNYSKVLEFQQQRIQALKQLTQIVQNFSSGFSGAQNEADYAAVEKLVANLNKNVEAYTVEDFDTHSKFSDTQNNLLKESKNCQDLLINGDSKIANVTKQRAEAKQVYDAALAKIDNLIGLIDFKRLSSLQKINPDVKINFDQVWIWTIDVVYDTATSKYDWDNFKENAFVKDGGKDFVSRIKGFNYKKMSSYTIGYTKKIVSLKGYLQKSLNSGDIDAYIDVIEQIVVASEARENYRVYSHDLKKTTLAVSSAKVKSEQLGKTTQLANESHTNSQIICKNIMTMNDELAVGYSNATPTGVRESQVNSEAVAKMQTLQYSSTFTTKKETEQKFTNEAKYETTDHYQSRNQKQASAYQEKDAQRTATPAQTQEVEPQKDEGCNLI